MTSTLDHRTSIPDRSRGVGEKHWKKAEKKIRGGES
jgi:hypothetical protein